MLTANRNDHLLRNHLWDPSKREGITHEQAEKLKNSNKRGVSEWDMWMNMWTIIFPDVDRPSTPCKSLPLTMNICADGSRL